MSTTATKFQVPASAAILIFTEMGLHAADKYPLATIAKKVKNLPQTMGDDQAPELKTKEAKDTLASILAAYKAEQDVEVVDDRKAAAKNGKAGKGAKKTAAKAEKAAKGKGKKAAGKPRAEKRERDKFGAIVGSDNAKFNALLTKKPQPMKDLMAAVPSKRAFYSYALTLIAAGKVKRDDKGYRLA